MFKSVNRDYEINKQLDFPMTDNRCGDVAATYDHVSGVAVLWVNNEKKEKQDGRLKLETNHALRLGSAANYHFSAFTTVINLVKDKANPLTKFILT